MFERAVTNSAKQGVLEYRHLNIQVPAWVDPADIESNPKKAILNRAQINPNKPIQQASGEFGPNPYCRSTTLRCSSAFSRSLKAQLSGTKAERRIFALDPDLELPLTQQLHQATTTEPLCISAPEEPGPWWLALWPPTAVSQLLLQAYPAWKRFEKGVISDSVGYLTNSKFWTIFYLRKVKILSKNFPVPGQLLFQLPSPVWQSPAPLGQTGIWDNADEMSRTD